ncbi:hypothetical protein [Paenibacillus spongiae]|uniref:Glycosyl hydrolase-like 10 domain-containing protein n=1 Tax=Paenibacillus spongiae TaxID=2909671 RepID=A0ABY5S4W0_9BACL|nr:hypothetical protein [Paenibacillus spongiae]UVI27600.1 hypothetical protein L1F29_19225 [Paenibacillus spongiae]
MLKGFMDHWVPTRDPISKFWKQDYETAANAIDELKSEIDFDHFTFYTKWYTNGVKSKLPYLYNHPEASNVKTDNEWGRRIVNHLHEKGISVGAMLQFLTYDQHVWERDLSIDEWDVGGFAETEQPVSIADFTDARFQARVKEIIREQLAEFPGIDYLFLEFEGVKSEALQVLYGKWAEQRGEQVPQAFQFCPTAIEHCKQIGQQLTFIWSDEAASMLRHYYKLNLQAVQDVLKEIGYVGKVGVVIHVYGYEAFIYPDILPDTSWWLVPWHYWVFDHESEETERKKAISKALMTKWKLDGHHVCYLGDVTMGRNGFNPAAKIDAIREFYQFSVDLDLEGYLGMGNPVPDIGLKWEAVTNEHVLDVRNLYKELYRGKRHR